ncbi:hypothetical protein AAMO2058_001626900 [Amorphochlora amoebiformis]
MECTNPAVAVARSRVIDYFNAQKIKGENQIFTWEKKENATNDPAFNALIRKVCNRRSYKFPQPFYSCLNSEHNNKLYHAYLPELGFYADIVMFFKLSLVTDKKGFLTSREDCRPYVDLHYYKLHWNFDRNRECMNVTISARSGNLLAFISSATKGLFKPTPADTSELVKPHGPAENEVDILYIKALPNFDKTIGQRDSELLLSYLTVPYLRIPLILGFFATEERIHAVRSKTVQKLINAVLFEPGALGDASIDTMPATVPVKSKDQLATAYGYLINELVAAPKPTLDAIKKMVFLVLGLNMDSVEQTTTRIIVFIFVLAARVLNYSDYILNAQTEAESFKWKGRVRERALRLNPENFAELKKGHATLHKMLIGPGLRILKGWDKELRARKKTKLVSLDEESYLSSHVQDLVSYCSIILHRNFNVIPFTIPTAQNLLQNFMFLSVQMTWNSKKGLHEIDEIEMYDVLQQNRRRMVSLLLSSAENEVNNVFDDALAHATDSTGDRTSRQWGILVSSAGRFAVYEGAYTRKLAETPLQLRKIFDRFDKNKDSYLSYKEFMAWDEKCLTADVRKTILARFEILFDEESAKEFIPQEWPNIWINGYQWMDGNRGKGFYRTTIAPVSGKGMPVPKREIVVDKAKIEKESQNPFSEARFLQIISVVSGNKILGINPVSFAKIYEELCILSQIPNHYKKLFNHTHAYNERQSVLVRTQDFSTWRKAEIVEHIHHKTETESRGEKKDQKTAVSTPKMQLTRQSSLIETEAQRVELFRQRKKEDRENFDILSPKYKVRVEDTGEIVEVTEVKLREPVEEETVEIKTDAKSFVLGDSDLPSKLFNTKLRKIKHTTDSGVEINLQSMQIKLRDIHVSAAPTEVAASADVLKIFKGKKIQCVRMEKASRREILRVVGEEYELHWWSDAGGPWPRLQKNYTHYDPTDLMEDEDYKWILDLFEPLRVRYFREARIFIPDDDMKEKANILRLEACVPGRDVIAVIYLYKLEMVAQCFKSVPHGWRFYNSLWWSSNCWLSFGELQPDADDRKVPWGTYLRHHAEAPSVVASPTVVWRLPSHADNIAGCRERFMPRYLLKGMIPEALLARYQFWQDERDNLRGYEIDVKKNDIKTLLEVTLKNGVMTDVTQCKGSVVRIVRKVIKKEQTQQKDKQDKKDKKTFMSKKNKKKKKLQKFRTTAGTEEEDLVLINLLHTRPSTPLYTLARVLTRVERLSYCLAWAKASDPKLRVHVVELPRMKLTFKAQKQGAVTRLCSMDHADLMVSNYRGATVNDLLQGIPHSLLLCNSNEEHQLLVPSVPPHRPYIWTCPFSTELVLGLSNFQPPMAKPVLGNEWRSNCDTPFYLYPVHISESFVYTPNLASTTYLLVLRFLNRNYPAVFQLASAIGTDTNLTTEQAQIFDFLKEAASDRHPDSHACRLKISLVTMDSPISLPWNVEREMDAYITKISHVSAACRLTKAEELLLLDKCNLSEDDRHREINFKGTSCLCDPKGIEKLKQAKDCTIEFWFSHKISKEPAEQLIMCVGNPPKHTLAIGVSFYIDKTRRVYYNRGGGKRRRFKAIAHSYFLDVLRSNGEDHVRIVFRHKPLHNRRGSQRSSEVKAEWQHMAVNIAGTKASMFIDGKALSKDTHTPISPLDSKHDFKPLFLGGPITRNYDCFDGSLDEIRIFKKVVKLHKSRQRMYKRMFSEDPVAHPLAAEVQGLIKRYVFQSNSHPVLVLPFLEKNNVTVEYDLNESHDSDDGQSSGAEAKFSNFAEAAITRISSSGLCDLLLDGGDVRLGVSPKNIRKICVKIKEKEVTDGKEGEDEAEKKDKAKADAQDEKHTDEEKAYVPKDETKVEGIISMAPTLLKRQMSLEVDENFGETEFRDVVCNPPEFTYPSSCPLMRVFDHYYQLRNRKWKLEATNAGRQSARCGCPRIKQGDDWMSGRGRKEMALADLTKLKGYDLAIDYAPWSRNTNIVGQEIFSILDIFWCRRFETLLGGSYSMGGWNNRTLTGKGFAWFYMVLTGEISVSINGSKDSHAFGSLLSIFLKDIDERGPYQSLIHVLTRNPKLCKSLPRFQNVFAGKLGGNNLHLTPTNVEFKKLMTDVKSIISKEKVSRWGPLDWGPDESKWESPQPKPTEVTIDEKENLIMDSSQSVPVNPKYRHRISPVIRDFNCSRRVLRAVELKGGINIDEKLIHTLANRPLQSAGFDSMMITMRRSELKIKGISSELPPVTRQCVSTHPEARNKVAIELKQRLVEEMKHYAESVNSSSQTIIKGMSDEDMQVIVKDPSDPRRSDAITKLRKMGKVLMELKAEDEVFVNKVREHVSTRCNDVSPRVGEAKDPVRDLSRSIFVLNRYSRRETVINFNYIVAALLSSDACFDVLKLNPFLKKEELESLFDAVVAVVLRTSRMGQINRCLQDVDELLTLLDSKQPTTEKEKEALVTELVQKAGALVRNITCKRHFIREEKGVGLIYDPRYLVFEFTWNLLLRKKQINLIDSFMETAKKGESSVKQLIMGAGKTTVVCPILSLMLGDGDSLVVQVVPQALLPFSIEIMRATFSSVVQKRVYTFIFDRSTKISPNLFTKLDNARVTRGILVTHPTALKSIMLRFVEILSTINDSARKRTPFLEHEASEVHRVLDVFRSSVVLMDEVDLILHPLKSELNFPIGPKNSLDFEPLRWQLAIHILDALFYYERGSISVDFKKSKSASKILNALKEQLKKGCENRMIQQRPHVVLLDEDFYRKTLKPTIAEWIMLWLEVNHTTATVSSQSVREYLMRGADTTVLKHMLREIQKGETSSCKPEMTKEEIVTEIKRREDLQEYLNENLDAGHLQMISLARDWCTSYLPHVMQKINRVTFGILNETDIQRAIKRDPHMPKTRVRLAIPFVGKDKPSESSEFAHPDIIIGLTVLAYRYSGMRKVDFHETLTHLVTSFQKELGPAHERKSSVRHATWVKESGGVVKGTKRKYDEEGNEIKTDDVEDDEEQDEKEVVPLQMLKPSNAEQVKKLFNLVRLNPSTIHWYLTEFIFPSNTMHQVVKLSASGQALGGDMLIDRRIGFSGTPSSLLPLEMGKCGYEKGADGLMIQFLTSPKIVSYENIKTGWSPKSLLDQIASAEPHYHALIDTGALITGMSNLEVAQYLLENGLKYAEGVIFLNEDDDKMVYVRSTGRVVRLDQCGIPKSRRFAFYDQIHTTGVDIQHVNNAVGVLTLGKDMVFRDYTQGTFRMRGLGKGQRIHLFLIPEVSSLIRRELSRAEVDAKVLADEEVSAMLDKITAWQVVNGMKSQAIQYNQLQLQNVANVWRKKAFTILCQRHASFKVRKEKQDLFLSKVVEVFEEDIDFKVARRIEQPIQFDDLVKSMVDTHEAFLGSQNEKKAVENIISEVKFLLRSSEDLNMEITTQATREQTVEQDKDQEKEVLQEKFVDLAYTNDRDDDRFWPIERLKSLEASEQFYPCNNFALYGQKSLKFTKDLLVSNNYFDKTWKGDRRLKNVVMVLEWIPDATQIRISNLTEHKLTEDQKNQLEKAFSLFDSKQSKSLDRKQIAKIMRAAIDYPPAEADIREMMGKEAHVNRDKAMVKLEHMLTSGYFRKLQKGRYFVALTLAEAETIRRAIHVRGNRPFFEGKNTVLSLRCLPDGFSRLDTSPMFQPSSTFQVEAARHSLRFLDCDMYYTAEELNILLKTLQGSTIRERENFFSLVIACRRRTRKKWVECPIAKLFTLPDEFHLLKLRAGVERTREAIERKGMQLQDAFTLFDIDENGVLSPEELYGALEWLGVSDLTPADIMDLVRHVDMNRDGNIGYGEFAEAIRGTGLSPSATTGADGIPQSVPPSLVRTPSTAAAFEAAKAGKHVITPKGVQELKQLQMQEIKQQKLREKAEAAREKEIEKRKKEQEGDLTALLRRGMYNPVKEEPFTVKVSLGAKDGKERKMILSTITTWEFTKKVMPKGVQVKGGVMQLQPDPEFEKKFNYLFVKPSSYVSIPFSKVNGGEGCNKLNQFTLSIEILVDRLPRKKHMYSMIHLSSLASKAKDGRLTSILFLHSNGSISFKRVPGDIQAARANQWFLLTVAVDNIAGTYAVYVDGQLHDFVARKDVMYMDGPLAIQSGFGLFKSENPREMAGGNVRRMYLHTEVLTKEAIQKLEKDLPTGPGSNTTRKKLASMGFPNYGIDEAINSCGESLQMCINYLRMMGYNEEY